MTRLDVLLGSALIASIVCLTAVTVTDHDVAPLLSVVTALIGLIGGKKISSDA